MLNAIEVVAEMAAVGFKLPADTFTELMKGGPQLLAPTGTDLKKFGQKDRIIAGWYLL